METTHLSTQHPATTKEIHTDILLTSRRLLTRFNTTSMHHVGRDGYSEFNMYANDVIILIRDMFADICLHRTFNYNIVYPLSFDHFYLIYTKDGGHATGGVEEFIIRYIMWSLLHCSGLLKFLYRVIHRQMCSLKFNFVNLKR